MRKERIAKLDHKERQWLYKALAKVALADKVIDEAEADDFKTSLTLLAKLEHLDLKDYLGSPAFARPLKPLPSISHLHAFYIFAEIARVAASDARLVEDETQLLHEYMDLLGFSEQAKPVLLQWVGQMSRVNEKEKQLLDQCDSLFPA